jgi:hypothetical protein
MTPTPPRQMLDVPTLLEASQPVARAPWAWFGFLFLGGLAITGTLYRPSGPQAAGAQALLNLLLFSLLAGMFALTMFTNRSVLREQAALTRAGELLQLRRWPEAARLLDETLSSPMRSHPGRLQALAFLAALLARYHRFGEAIEVYEHVLSVQGLDPGTVHGLKLGRALAQLRDDRLYDADRSLADLRRVAGSESPGLELVELYREFKTGHARDAVERFNRCLPLLKRGLGHRCADAWSLAAGANHVLGEAAAAQRCWTIATALMPPLELTQRFPELAAVASACQPCPTPPEAA